MGIYEELAAYGESGHYPYHMPGHKRNRSMGPLADFFQIDITEIDGFDNLHQARGMIKQAQERAARLYGAEETFFLVNGSTCGILAAVSAVTDRRDSLLIARNCHKSVYHAAFLRELALHYLYPGQVMEYDIADAVSADEVEAALEAYPECRAVVITSPTYEGIAADVRGIAEVVHAWDKILIVDEAHGAHFGFSDDLPENSVRQGADLVIHSLHKTLPSMTQTALLHVSGSRINRRKLRKYLSIYQSSSPSYVLMASIDACVSYVNKSRPFCFDRLRQHYQKFMARAGTCRYLRIAGPGQTDGRKYCYKAWDLCKLVISAKGAFLAGMPVSGQRLYDILREEFHLQPEMAAGSYVLAIMTIADGEEDWLRLADALLQIDSRIEGRTTDSTEGGNRVGQSDMAEDEAGPARPKIRMTVSQALLSALEDGREIPFLQAEGKTAGDFINLYPPGIPLLVPGEEIGADMIRQIEKFREDGLQVQGISDKGKVVIC